MFGYQIADGADVVLTNLQTGEVVELQLKATDSVSYITEHLDKYPDIAVVATSEVAGRIEGVEDSGFTNESVTTDLHQTIHELGDQSLDAIAGDVVEDFFQIGQLGALVSEGVNAYQSVKKGEAVKIDTEKLKSVGKRAAVIALFTGIVF